MPHAAEIAALKSAVTHNQTLIESLEEAIVRMENRLAFCQRCPFACKINHPAMFTRMGCVNIETIVYGTRYGDKFAAQCASCKQLLTLSMFNKMEDDVSLPEMCKWYKDYHPENYVMYVHSIKVNNLLDMFTNMKARLPVIGDNMKPTGEYITTREQYDDIIAQANVDMLCFQTAE